MENIFKDIPSVLPDELVEIIAGDAEKGIRFERIISHGQASPSDFWYDQEKNEFVMVLKGKAGLIFKERNGIFELSPGDYLEIPAHTLHRVEWTSAEEDTVWLAVHY